MQPPMVSVGIPTYNRPSGLKQTIEYFLSQPYQNLDIVISDNASPDAEVKRIIEQFQKQDSRIRYFRQPENIGPQKNFLFVLEQATGKYFMWAADDDKWEDFYITRLVECLESLGDQFVAANCEAQYIDEHGATFEFFAEGTPFYTYRSDAAYDRLKRVLQYNYGNLFYSLYRREVLQKQKVFHVENEVPFLLQIIQHGNWKVLPLVGFYKKTVMPTYLQARWEMEGGYLGPVTKTHLFRRARHFLPNATQLWKYHRDAMQSIFKAIDTIAVRNKQRAELKNFVSVLIWKHLIQLSWGYKRKPSL
jgi:glycosyltransferase domain-containing protein